MRRRVVSLVFGLVVGAPGYSLADGAPAPLIGSITAISDYRYRGLSLSKDRPVLQAELFYTGPDAFYGDLFGSTLEFMGSRQEVDLTVGKRTHLAGVDLDVGLTRFVFLGAQHLDYWELPVSVSRTVGPWTWTGGAAYAPRQGGTNDRPNAYSFTRLEWRQSDNPYSFAGSIGFENGAFARHKLDWSLTTMRALRSLRLSLTVLGDGGSTRKSEVTLVASLGAGF